MKRMLDWSTKGTELVMSEYKGKDKPSVELTRFDIGKIFPDYKDMTEVQKFIVEYGMKQKLADGGSSNVGDVASKDEVAKEKFQMFLDGKLTGVRLNATGAKENKRIVTAVRETAKIVSLEGLITKKNLFPDTFTKEDEKKLGEFMGIVSKHNK